MRPWMAAAAGFALLASAAAANAQNAPASTNSNPDKATQMAPSSQSATPRATPRKHVLILKHRPNRHAAMRHRSTTTGAGSRVGPVGGPQNDPSIHQSIQRDSRGTPKGPGSDYNK